MIDYLFFILGTSSLGSSVYIVLRLAFGSGMSSKRRKIIRSCSLLHVPFSLHCFGDSCNTRIFLTRGMDWNSGIRNAKMGNVDRTWDLGGCCYADYILSRTCLWLRHNLIFIQPVQTKLSFGCHPHRHLKLCHLHVLWTCCILHTWVYGIWCKCRCAKG